MGDTVINSVVRCVFYPIACVWAVKLDGEVIANGYAEKSLVYAIAMHHVHHVGTRFEGFYERCPNCCSEHLIDSEHQCGWEGGGEASDSAWEVVIGH